MCVFRCESLLWVRQQHVGILHNTTAAYVSAIPSSDLRCVPGLDSVPPGTMTQARLQLIEYDAKIFWREQHALAVDHILDTLLVPVEDPCCMRRA